MSGAVIWLLSAAGEHRVLSRSVGASEGRRRGIAACKVGRVKDPPFLTRACMLTRQGLRQVLDGSELDDDVTAMGGYVCGGSGELVPLRLPPLFAKSPPVSLSLLLGDEPPPLIHTILQLSTGSGRLRQCRRGSPQRESDLVGRSPSMECEYWGTSHQQPVAIQNAWDGISTMPRLVHGRSPNENGGRENKDESDCSNSGGNSCSYEAPFEDPQSLPQSRGLANHSATGGRRPRNWPGTAAAVKAFLNASRPVNQRQPHRAWRPPRSGLPHTGRRQGSRGPPPPPPLQRTSMHGQSGRKPGRPAERQRLPSRSPGSPITPLEAVHNRSIEGSRPARSSTAAPVPPPATVATADAVAQELPPPPPVPPGPQQWLSPTEAAAAAARAAALVRFRNKKRRGLDFSGATRYVRRAVESTRRARLGGRFVSWAEYNRQTGKDGGGVEKGGEEGDRQESWAKESDKDGEFRKALLHDTWTS